MAEDLVMEAWERAAAAFDPERGSFDALLLRVAENGFRYWWRREVRERQVKATLVGGEVAADRGIDLPPEIRAGRAQQRVIDALDPDERRLFTTWALQVHLPRGRFTSEQAASSLDLSLGAYDHARRRLKARILEILDEHGLSPRDLLTLADDERPERKRR